MKRSLLYLVTEDWYFVSHRAALARAARDAGWNVTVATRVDRHGDAIRDDGHTLIPLSTLRRGSTNPAREAATVAELVAIYTRVRPSLAHHVAVKPVLYGSIAATVTRTPAVINALAGFGWSFIGDSPRQRLVGSTIQRVLRATLRGEGMWTLLQNPDDLAQLREAGLIDPARTAIIRGSGVDVDRFAPSPEPDGPMRVLLGARMLRDKGVVELVDAARLLRSRGLSIIVALAGTPDPENPATLDAAQLEQWRREGLVEVLGHVGDMAGALRDAHIACLPSYREGTPKFLLEAAAAGRAIVTTDVPGCREVVTHGDNGLLVPARAVAPLADAIERLAVDPALRARMGRRGRERALHEFSIDSIIHQTLGLYEQAWETRRERHR